MFCRNGRFAAAVLLGLLLGVPPHDELARGVVVVLVLVVSARVDVYNYGLRGVVVLEGGLLISDVC